MIGDLNKTIKTLIINALPKDLVAQIKITFSAPDKLSPPPAGAPLLLYIFLYCIRENLELRESTYLTGSKPNTPLIYIDYSYLLTAWCGGGSDSSGTDNSTQEEHDLLNRTLQALLPYPTWPSNLLQGELATIQPPPSAHIVQADHLQSMDEFWSAIGKPPKAALHYTVTAPFYYQTGKALSSTSNTAQQTQQG
ncbi:DUF4255 domain-containing protein [Candidatus Regiella insecticola]|uniref:Pvc16 N-terminal domain-containing protein n=1 Tax=Candidatus Regiella insecticola TaxID=138073 RepID=A0A6L2ZNP1_9ENTR|nr:DUF4255 domain-containing protein [Candidatus Regiella insecticola]GFN46366.1 uncharacterized protein RINTU1_19110 [Candidatus Regiella insecticola]GFN47413.1 hypothetical protein RINTU1_34760 [Candidatus Regiella insecticola]